MPYYTLSSFNELFDYSLTILEGPEISKSWQEFCDDLIPEAAVLALADQLEIEDLNNRYTIDWGDIKVFILYLLKNKYRFKIANLPSAFYSGGVITEDSDKDYGDPTSNELLKNSKAALYAYNENILNKQNKTHGTIEINLPQ